MSVQEVRCRLGDNDIIIETGKMAKQAGGSVTVRCGDSIVLVTATSAAKAKEECDFLPLTVEYLEKTFAAGKIPGGFFKREGRPSETAVLVSRFIDRPVRPLFPDNYYFDTQVIVTVLSASPENPPELLGIIGASAALCISDIPFKKPIAGCRVSRINGEFKLNIGLDQQHLSDLDLVVAASEDAVVMVEGEGKEVLEADFVKAIEFAFSALKPVIAMQKELMAKCGKPKRSVPVPETSDVVAKTVGAAREKIKAALAIKVKLDRYAALAAIKDELKAVCISKESPYAHKLQFNTEFENVKSDLIRADILDNHHRIDGRGLADIRPITCEVELLPRAHGSALFTRGETQALVVATLGSSDDEQIIDGLLGEHTKRFMLNYNFPSFSVGEVKPLRSPGRREIGHGHLAERALHNMLPDQGKFPYTIRIVSEILESNGSSSMASVCGGSLAMMDAGVPIKAPVAGIAMGLILEKNKHAVLSDILGDEDHLGDMDFKVTGTEKGVTAVQMDIKVEGITTAIMQQALTQAKEGRLHILSVMNKTRNAHRNELSQYAPRFELVKIPVDRIKDVIGPGGKIIKGIVEQTGAKIDIEDDGTVRIFSSDGVGMQQAVDMVKACTAEAEVGKLYTGKVKKITTFGAFIEILPKIEGLLHISQIVERRINAVTDVLQEGDVVTVKVLEIDGGSGKMRLSMRDVEQPQGREIA